MGAESGAKWYTRRTKKVRRHIWLTSDQKRIINQQGRCNQITNTKEDGRDQRKDDEFPQNIKSQIVIKITSNEATRIDD